MQSRLKLQEMLRIKEEFNNHLTQLENYYEKVFLISSPQLNPSRVRISSIHFQWRSSPIAIEHHILELVSFRTARCRYDRSAPHRSLSERSTGEIDPVHLTMSICKWVIRLSFVRFVLGRWRWAKAALVLKCVPVGKLIQCVTSPLICILTSSDWNLLKWMSDWTRF